MKLTLIKIITILIFSLYLIVPAADEFKSKDDLKIIALDIGQGDATLLKLPDHKIILIDTGPGNVVIPKLSKYMPYWVRKIDYLVLTHPHYDHIGAIQEILNKYDVGKIIWFEAEYDSATYDWLESLDRRNPSEFQEYLEDEKVNLDGVRFYFIFPNVDTARNDPNVNNESVIFLLKYRDFTGLFPGDAENQEELEFLPELQELMTRLKIDHVTYLKGAHHCSNTSNDPELLSVIRVEIATCSLGKNNSYHHPGRNTIRNFEKFGVKYLRTDQKGDISIDTDGFSYKIK